MEKKTILKLLTNNNKNITNMVTSNINKYWRLFSFKKIKFWFIKVIKVNTPNKTAMIEMVKNHLKFFIVFNILIS